MSPYFTLLPFNILIMYAIGTYVGKYGVLQ